MAKTPAKTTSGFRRAVAKMALLKFFPGGEDERAELMAELGRVCASDEQVMWLAQRTVDLYREWPGLQAIWQIWFSKFRPKNDRERMLDRQSEISAAYPTGVPSETGRTFEHEPAILPAAGSEAAGLLAKAAAGVKALPEPEKPFDPKGAAKQLEERAAARKEVGEAEVA